MFKFERIYLSSFSNHLAFVSSRAFSASRLITSKIKDFENLFSQDELKSIAEARGIDTQNNRKWQEQLEKDWDNSL